MKKWYRVDKRHAFIRMLALIIKMKSKFKNLLLILICFLISSCNFDDSFNQELLDDFKNLQKVVENNPEKIKGEYFDIADEYHRITKSNFEKLFSFTTPELKKRFKEMFENKEITRIEIWDKNCIQIRIRPDYNNSLIKSEWNELWIIYNSGCDCVCHKRINQIDIPEEKIDLIEKNWYKVVSKNRRYIGG